MSFILLSLTAILQTETKSPGTAKDLARIEVARKAYEARDCATVVRTLKPYFADRQAEALGDGIATAVLSVGAQCQASLGALDEAYGLALRATRYPDAQFGIWMLRYGQELQAGRTAEAVTTIETLANGNAALLNEMESQWLVMLDTRLKAAGQADLRRRLLKVLAESYDPDVALGSADRFRQLYAGLLYQAGDRSAARAIVQNISAPSVLRELMVDPRLRDTLPPKFSIRAATEARLDRDRGLMAARPDRLQWPIAIASDLRQLGRPSEALTLLEGIRDKVAKGEFADGKDYQAWWWNSLSNTQRMLGRYDDAIASLRSGMVLSENGGRNISQVLNLVGLLNEAGRPQQALDALTNAGELGTASPYGEMQRHSVRGVAYALLGRTAEAAADRAYLEAHSIDAPAAVGELLLWMKDYDAAAANVIARLADPEERQAVLLDFSDYPDPPVKTPPTVYERSFEIVAARADVKAALTRAGGTAKFDVQGTN